MSRVIAEAYELPIQCYLMIVVCSVLVWTLVSLLFKNRLAQRIVNMSILVIAMILVFIFTIVIRNYKYPEYNLIPFYIFGIAKQHSDIYNQMLLNVILFLPIGLSMPFAIEKVVKRPVLMTVIFSTAFSVAIEILQYIFAKGYSEIDDVWLNTLGAVVGAMSYLISKYLARLFKGRNKFG